MHIFGRLRDSFQFGQAVGEELEINDISEEEEGREEGSLSDAIQYCADENNVNITGTIERVIYQIGVGNGRAKV